MTQRISVVQRPSTLCHNSREYRENSVESSNDHLDICQSG